MSVITVCDWCGENIAPGSDDATLSVTYGGGWERCGRSGYIGHYHDSCHTEVRDRLDLVLESGRSLERIPVATGQKIAQFRKRHIRTPTQDDA